MWDQGVFLTKKSSRNSNILSMSSTTEPEIKQLSPGTTLVRHEDTETNAVVYTVNNSASDVRWRFTLDFRTSKNFTLLKNLKQDKS